MSTNHKGPLPPQEQLSDEELDKLIMSDKPEDWQKIDASLDAEFAAMTPEDRAELDSRVDLLQWRIAKILESHGRKVFN